MNDEFEQTKFIAEFKMEMTSGCHIGVICNERLCA